MNIIMYNSLYMILVIIIPVRCVPSLPRLDLTGPEQRAAAASAQLSADPGTGNISVM